MKGGMVAKETEQDFASMLAEFAQRDERGYASRVRVGDNVRARVARIGQESAVLEIADGSVEGMIDLDQLRDGEGNLSVKVGDEIEARVAETMGKQGSVVLRRAMARGLEAKAELAQAAELGLAVEGTVMAVNKGGVEVLVAGVRGFCPISQLEARHVADANPYVGCKFQFRITRYDCDRRGANLVVSRRVLLEEEARARSEKIRAKLVVGAVLSGTVVTLKDFGAFIDLGGGGGHVARLRAGIFASQPAERGFGCRTAPRSADHQDRKDGRCQTPGAYRAFAQVPGDGPWEEVATRFPPGTQTSGKVVRVEPFGAFVELAQGIEGLVHASEWADGRPVRHARELCKVGDLLTVTVLALDLERRRISLGAGERGEALSPEDLAAARAAAGPARFGTLGDLLRAKKT